jgi:hypothetical protein
LASLIFQHYHPSWSWLLARVLPQPCTQSPCLSLNPTVHPLKAVILCLFPCPWEMLLCKCKVLVMLVGPRVTWLYPRSALAFMTSKSPSLSLYTWCSMDLEGSSPTHEAQICSNAISGSSSHQSTYNSTPSICSLSFHTVMATWYITHCMLTAHLLHSRLP